MAKAPWTHTHSCLLMWPNPVLREQAVVSLRHCLRGGKQGLWAGGVLSAPHPCMTWAITSTLQDTTLVAALLAPGKPGSMNMLDKGHAFIWAFI